MYNLHVFFYIHVRADVYVIPFPTIELREIQVNLLSSSKEFRCYTFHTAQNWLNFVYSKFYIVLINLDCNECLYNVTEKNAYRNQFFLYRTIQYDIRTITYGTWILTLNTTTITFLPPYIYPLVSAARFINVILFNYDEL